MSPSREPGLESLRRRMRAMRSLGRARGTMDLAQVEHVEPAPGLPIAVSGIDFTQIEDGPRRVGVEHARALVGLQG